MDGITIDENENYQEVHIAICVLNETISQEKEKYKYTGQTPHSLAYAYYSNNYDRQIISKRSPQIYDILTSKASMNSPLFELYAEKGQTAYDKNKQYTDILMNCDKFGWAIYMPTDEVKPFDGTIDIGRYCIETTDCFA